MGLLGIPVTLMLVCLAHFSLLLLPHTGVPHFMAIASLHFADTVFFYELKVCSSTASNKCIGTIFPIASMLTSCFCVAFW